jgi:putative membrane protein
MLVKNNYESILYFIKYLWLDIVSIVAYAAVLAIIDHYTFLRKISIPLSITTVTGTIVALLLAFRTSQSYDRWWEARKVWGEIVNDSRTLIRQLKQFLPTESTEMIVAEFAQRQIIWCFALSESLRKVPYSAKVQSYLSNQNIKANNIPCELLNRHAQQLAEVSCNFKLDPHKQVQIDTTILRLNDAMGKCERIKNTVFPRPYSLLIHFLIYVLASILPFGLDNVFPVIEIVLTIIIPLVLIAVEETAIIMQDPFEDQPSDIPMTALCNTIENNINEIISAQNIKSQVTSDLYYIN